ncbi:MAG: outer membrane beta-barrel protein [Planctomycetota bacterium]
MKARIFLIICLVAVNAASISTASSPSYFDVPEYGTDSDFKLVSFLDASEVDCDCLSPLRMNDPAGLFADSDPFPCDVRAPSPQWDAGGWLAVGYHNKSLPLSRNRGDGRSFNDVPGSFNVNQLWFYTERRRQSGPNPDWGMRADFVYGTDAQKTQAFGGTGWDNSFDNGVYGWAIPQLYLEFGAGDVSVKAGHFFTLVGYEVVATPENFFYSRSLTMFNSEPFTHSGVLTTYEASESLTLHGGWVAGWDSGFEVNDGGSMFLGGFTRNLTDAVGLTYITTIGDTGSRGDGAYSHSVVVSVDVSEDSQYVIQSDLLSIDSTSEDDLGLNQYFFYDLNERWRWGNRVEWWKNDGVSFWEFTTGLNFTPRENAILRTEIRYDRGPTAYDQTAYGIDAIWKF